jgi:DNA-binding HxlR family transcriptional regulator
MANHKSAPDVLRQAAQAYIATDKNEKAAAKLLNIARSTFQQRLKQAEKQGMVKRKEDPWKKPFEIAELPSDAPDAEDLRERIKKNFARKEKAEVARRLVPIKINIDGPIAVAHFGDPHVDDDGCDMARLERDVGIVNRTEGMFAANLGDSHNNWVGRLARLYGEQATSAKEAWVLVEWLTNSMDWIYIIGGNHDLWSGAGDPLKWISKQQGTAYEAWGVRAALKFPNGKEVRINARHDFSGHSMWNPNHGPMKAVQAGWRDHVATAGHKHISFITGPLTDPATGLLSWTMRCAGYKRIDRYAQELGLPNQAPFATGVTIFDPRYADDDPRLVTLLPDLEMAADFLKFLRGRK